VRFRFGGNSVPKDGWRKKKNAIIVPIVVTSYSGGRRGAETVNNPLMWIDNGKKLINLFYLHWLRPLIEAESGEEVTCQISGIILPVLITSLALR